MPFVLPLIWYIPYYLFFNLVFLIPMSLLIFIFQLILVFFFGDNKVTTNICMTLAFLVLMVEFWLIFRASYIKTFEQRNFFQAAKDSLIELRLGLKMILKK
ncbi:hypothetical protein [Acinetobacter baumannii]|uniref:hypothetical protein n=1 Tax=Acinetobacter baumannii TaxID=470 RepID=UPI003A80402C